MGNAIGMYRTFNKMLSQWQYVAPEGYAFYYNGICQGRIIWTASPEGYYTAKDEEDETE